MLKLIFESVEVESVQPYLCSVCISLALSKRICRTED